MSTYYIWSGAIGAGDGSSWVNAFTTVTAALSAVTEADGDVFLVASDHNETTDAAVTLSFNAYCYLISVNRTSGLPEAGAIIGALHKAGNNITVEGKVTGYGINFRAGVNPSGGTNTGITIGNLNTSLVSVVNLTNCRFELLHSGGAAYITFGRANNSNAPCEVNLKECVLKFGNGGQALQVGAAKFTWSGGGIDAAGQKPNYAIREQTLTGIAADILVSGVDLSWATNLIYAASTKAHASRMRFNNCLLPDNIADDAHPGPGYMEYFLQACGVATDDAAYQDYYLGGYGTYINNTGVYLTTGAASFKGTDGALVPMSLMLSASPYARNGQALYSPWFYTEVTSTGSKTLAMKIAHTLGAAMKDNEVWLEVEYMSETSNPKFSCALSAPLVTGTNLLDLLAAGSNLADTAEAWTGLTDEITHTLSKTVTVNQQGFVRVRLALAKPSATIYLNPEVLVS